MLRRRNKTCILTCKVGAKMTVRVPRVPRGIVRVPLTLHGGPLHGARIRMDDDAGLNTLPLAPMGAYSAGRYVKGTWAPL